MSLPLFRQHERLFERNRFVYPVLSRRSGGISVGVNLNPDKVCNFDCIYCQVDRVSHATTRFVEVERLLDELSRTLEAVTSGRLYETEKFRDVPSDLRVLRDIAFSGDGEPTTYRNFDAIVESCAQVKRDLGIDAKMVLITNASMFHRANVRRGLRVLDQNQGEIWAKLEAGTEEYYRLVERTTIPFSRILSNIESAARERPLVIQALFMKIDGQPPPADEIREFCDRLSEIVAAGGRFKLIQVYTVARKPAESCVAPLTDRQVDDLVRAVRRRTGLTVEGYYGADVS